MNPDTSADRHEWRRGFQTTTAVAIASALQRIEPEAGWTLERVDEHTSAPYYNPALNNTRGERFSLGLDDYKRRVTVYATYGTMPDGRRWMPRDRVRDAVDPAPTISADKTPDLIAKDIGRRFLPDYRKYLDLYRADVADATAFRAATSALFDDIVALGNGWITPNTRNDERSTERTASLSDAPGINYGDLRVSGDSVRIELSATPEFAKRFAALLAGTERQS